MVPAWTVVVFALLRLGDCAVQLTVNRLSPHHSLIIFPEADPPRSFHPADDESTSTILREVLGLGEGVDFHRVRDHGEDHTGHRHEVWEEYYRGVRVEDGVYHLLWKGRTLVSANGEGYQVDGLPTTPLLTRDEALEAARACHGAEMQDSGEPGEVVVAAGVLVYKLTLSASQPYRALDVYVDASSGEVVMSRDRLAGSAAGRAETYYSGVQGIMTTRERQAYILRDEGRKIHTFYKKYELQDDDNTWEAAEHLASQQALDAHWGLSVVYDYYKGVHGRVGYDGEGAWLTCQAVSEVGTLWDATRDIMHLALNWTTLDTVAHEFTHAVVVHSSRLVYYDESGALHEGFCDIFGAAVEHYYLATRNPQDRGKEVWEVFGEGPGGPLRSLRSPTAHQTPDRYRGKHWHDCRWNKSDYCGVHTNSAVLAHWFYMLSEGGEASDSLGRHFRVEGLDIERAAKIAYLTMLRLTPTSTFNVTRAVSCDTARMHGVDEHIAVAQAWAAVSLFSPSYGCPTAEGVLRISEVRFAGMTAPAGARGDPLAVPAGQRIPLELSVGETTHRETRSPHWRWVVSLDIDGDGSVGPHEVLAEEELGSTATTHVEVVVPFSAQRGVGSLRVDLLRRYDLPGCPESTGPEAVEVTVVVTAPLHSPCFSRQGAVAVHEVEAESLALLPTVFGESFTGEVWVRLASYTPRGRIFDFGNGAGRDNVLVTQVEGEGRLALRTYRGAEYKEVGTQRVVPLRQWVMIRVAVTRKKHSATLADGRLQVGEEVVEGEVFSPRLVWRGQCFLGRSGLGDDDETLVGELADFRLCPVVNAPTPDLSDYPQHSQSACFDLPQSESGHDFGPRWLGGSFFFSTYIRHLRAEGSTPWARVFDFGNGEVSNSGGVALAQVGAEGAIALRVFRGSEVSEIRTAQPLPLGSWVAVRGFVRRVGLDRGEGWLRVGEEVAEGRLFLPRGGWRERNAVGGGVANFSLCFEQRYHHPRHCYGAGLGWDPAGGIVGLPALHPSGGAFRFSLRLDLAPRAVPSEGMVVFDFGGWPAVDNIMVRVGKDGQLTLTTYSWGGSEKVVGGKVGGHTYVRGEVVPRGTADSAGRELGYATLWVGGTASQGTVFLPRRVVRRELLLGGGAGPFPLKLQGTLEDFEFCFLT